MSKILASTAAMALLIVGAITVPIQAEEGWHAGVDLLFLSPKLNEVGLNNIFYYENGPAITDTDGNIASSELDFAQRLIIGYEGKRGGGIQVRWFTFDNTVAYSGSVEEGGSTFFLNGDLNIDVDALDIELTQRGRIQAFDWLATAGVRYARVAIREDLDDDLEWEQLTDTVWFGATGVEFEGAGPTVSVEGNRPIFWEGFSIFSRARTSLLFGDTSLFSAFESGGQIAIPDEFVQVWELQLGVQWECEYEAFDLVSGIFWEAQRWDSDTQLLGNLAFHGFGVHTGIEY